MQEFAARLKTAWPEIEARLERIYPGIPAAEKSRLKAILKEAEAARAPALKARDAAGGAWYQSQDVVAMTLYTDLFAGNFAGVREKIPYFLELGITLIHFMPLLKPREGDNDGGYAVADYRQTDPRLGSMAELEALVAELAGHGIASCIDFVVNHTAKEHPWALAARAGDPEAQALYFMYDTDELPKQFEQTVPQVFPGVAPGNFTWYPELKKWVWTSFYEFQWDLNYSHPRVLELMVETLLFLANRGIGMIRLDAIPFMWKELGTTCRNLPVIHDILAVLRLAGDLVCPSVVLLGEAIVEPVEIVKYFGTDSPECRVMYNATGMVNLWNSLATRETHLFYDDHNLHPVPDWAVWINYARCHDDIGWGFNESAIANLGRSPEAHKQFLIRFFEGVFEGSFARGELYEYNPVNQDARNSGTLASLCGLERALEEGRTDLVKLALARIKAVHSFILAGRGFPLIYSGDELATLNNHDYKLDPAKAHDSRWLHRVNFDWDRAKKRRKAGTPEAEVFGDLVRRISVRKSEPLLAATVPAEPVRTSRTEVFAARRSQAGRDLLTVFNFSERWLEVENHLLHCRPEVRQWRDAVTGREVEADRPFIALAPYETLWLVPADQGPAHV